MSWQFSSSLRSGFSPYIVTQSWSLISARLILGMMVKRVQLEYHCYHYFYYKEYFSAGYDNGDEGDVVIIVLGKIQNRDYNNREH